MWAAKKYFLRNPKRNEKRAGNKSHPARISNNMKRIFSVKNAQNSPKRRKNTQKRSVCLRSFFVCLNGAPSGTRTLGPMIKSLSGRWKHLKNRLFLRFFIALQPFYRAFDFPIWGKLGKTALFILRIRIFLLRKAEIRPKNAYRHLTSSYCRRGARPKAKRVPAGSRIPGPA